MSEILAQRQAGVLLHPTCLPSPYGIGDLGPEAHRYLQWLADAKIGWWQVLPLNPTGPGFSPYSSYSTKAGNVLLISPDLLLQDGLLTSDQLDRQPGFVDYLVDYRFVAPWKERLLQLAHANFRGKRQPTLAAELEAFRHANDSWLPDHCLFTAAKVSFRSAPWHQWPDGLAQRTPRALDQWRSELSDDVELEAFRQFLFFRQWASVRARAREVGVRILGDVPIFVDLDSADVWANREWFRLGPAGLPAVVAGVPPDYFSSEGQLWGNPLYDWQRLAADGYRWWIDRLRHAFRLHDAIRLDHFRAFVAAWEVEATATTATTGNWAPGPGRALFDAVAVALGDLPLVAEDLGTITDDVVALRKELGFPGMAILQFAFDDQPRSSFIPYALERDLVVYTGTHDNNTAVGWFFSDATDVQRDLLRRYAASDDQNVHWAMTRLAMASVADLAVIPHQDLAGLGGDCRMNRPGEPDGNWRFRITEWMLGQPIRERLAELVWLFGRTPGVPPAGGVKPAP